MFLQELSPLFQEFVQKPVAFMGGFASGLFRLDLSEDPVKTWLNQCGVTLDGAARSHEGGGSNSSGPQSIEID